MADPITGPTIDLETLRGEVRKEYAEVAANPAKGFHFHTGGRQAKILGYADELIDGIPSRNTLNKGSEGFSGGYWGSFAEILRPPGLFSQMCRPLISLRRGRCNL